MMDLSSLLYAWLYSSALLAKMLRKRRLPLWLKNSLPLLQMTSFSLGWLATVDEFLGCENGKEISEMGSMVGVCVCCCCDIMMMVELMREWC